MSPGKTPDTWPPLDADDPPPGPEPCEDCPNPLRCEVPNPCGPWYACKRDDEVDPGGCGYVEITAIDVTGEIKTSGATPTLPASAFEGSGPASLAEAIADLRAQGCNVSGSAVDALEGGDHD